MTAPPSTSTPKRPHARPRRVKRGIVAGYIHDISPRHRAASTPVTAATPIPAPQAPAAQPAR
jgi:hypothetical protein